MRHRPLYWNPFTKCFGGFYNIKWESQLLVLWEGTRPWEGKLNFG